MRALLFDLPVIIVDLELTVKRELGMQFDIQTPSENFVGKQFLQKFDARPGMWKATVLGFSTDLSVSSLADVFTLKYSDKREMQMPKSELLAHLCKATDKMEADPRWILRSKLLQYRFCRFSCYMLDMHGVMAALSCTQQGNGLTIWAFQRSVNKALVSLGKLKDNPGPAEADFVADCAKNNGANVYKLCPLQDCDAGLTQLSFDTDDVSNTMVKYINSRFTAILNKPEIHAFSVFDHRKWPDPSHATLPTYLRQDRGEPRAPAHPVHPAPLLHYLTPPPFAPPRRFRYCTTGTCTSSRTSRRTR